MVTCEGAGVTASAREPWRGHDSARAVRAVRGRCAGYYPAMFRGDETKQSPCLVRRCSWELVETDASQFVRVTHISRESLEYIFPGCGARHPQRQGHVGDPHASAPGERRGPGRRSPSVQTWLPWCGVAGAGRGGRSELHTEKTTCRLDVSSED